LSGFSFVIPGGFPALYRTSASCQFHETVPAGEGDPGRGGIFFYISGFACISGIFISSADPVFQQTMDAPDSTPLVSIILATYNSPRYLKEAIGSILCQTYTRFELIIVDDGSTDTTEAVLAGISDPRITVLRHPENYGFARALNSGLGASRGTFIGYIDSDDAWVPEKLAEQVACFARLPPEYGMVYSDMWEIDPAGNRRYWHSPDISGPDLFNRTTADYQVHCLGNGSTLVKREFLDRAGAFDERFSSYVDLDFFIRLSRVCLFHHIKKPLYVYRSGQGISSNLFKTTRSRLLLLKKYPETAQDRDGLVHQYDLICRNIRGIEAENRILRGMNPDSLAVNISCFFEAKIVRRLCPAGSRRDNYYHRGLDCLRNRLNPLLLSKKR
jgi:glycosyltransferase involved in cell wall biosynthesis